MIRIHYVTVTDKNTASTRYRIMTPANELNRLKTEFQASAGSEIPEGCDVYAFSKHFNGQDPAIAKHLSNQGAKILFDMCDDHFDTKHREHYFKMVSIADILTCSTPELAKRIAERTNKIAFVIPDPYEFDEGKAKATDSNPLRLLWFGHSANLDTLQNVVWRLHGYDLMVITGGLVNIGRFGKTIVKQWSEETMKEGFKWCDCVILPTLDDDRRKVKSTNRIVETIRAGRFAITGAVPSYEEFKPYAYVGDIVKGIDWYKANREAALTKILKGQKHVRQEYAPHVIGATWASVLKETV